MGILNSYLGYFILGGLLIISITLRFLKASKIKTVLKTLVILFMAWLLMMQTLVLSDFYARVPDNKEIDYLIVLGAGLKGDRVSYTLAYRLDQAIEYAGKHPEVKIIVSGGQGPDEWISEAEAMATYLIKNGIEDSRILREDRSTSTEENIKYSLALVENTLGADIIDDKAFALVTSNYHMYRAKYIARPFIEDIEGISAHSPYWSVINYMLRESATIANEWRKELFND